MKKLSLLIAVLFLLASGSAFAIAKRPPGYKTKSEKSKVVKKSKQSKKKEKAKKEKKKKEAKSEYPKKGWHKGFYLTGNIGIMQVTNDKHTVTGQNFDGDYPMAFGLTFGWDVADWIGPMFQVTFATETGDAGDPLNVTPQQYDLPAGSTYPAGTFPVESAREYAIDIGLFARATLPYFTRAKWQPKMIKFIPYIKVGGMGNAAYVNASTTANKVGSFGGGPAIGAGIEFFIWKGLFIAADFTQSFIFQKSLYKDIDITDSTGATVSQSTKITDGGLKYQMMFLGLIGWHF